MNVFSATGPGLIPSWPEQGDLPARSLNAETEPLDFS